MAEIWVSTVLVLALAAASLPPADHFQEALKEFRAGDLTAAHSDAEQALKLEPRSGPAHNLLGLIDVRQGQLQAAIAEFKQAVSLQPFSAAAHVNMGNAYVALNKDEEARREFLEAIHLRPEDAAALAGAGLAFARAGNDKEAVTYLDRAYRLDREQQNVGFALAAAYLDLKQTTAARLVIERLLNESGNPAQPAFESLAILALEADDYALAMTCVARDPTMTLRHAENAMARAQELVAAHDDHKALALLETIAAVKAGDAGYHDLLGTVEFNLSQPASAVDELQEAIRLEPHNTNHYFKLGMMFLKHRTAEGATLVFDAALKQQPASPMLWMGRGLSGYIQGNLTGAREDLYHAIALDPAYGPAYVVLCDLLSQTSQDQELLKVIDRAIAADPDNYLLPYYLGKVYERQGSPRAVPALKRSLQLNPRFAEAVFEMGKTFENSGDMPGAAAALEQCIRLKPGLVEAHYKLFHVYHLMGKKELADAQLKEFQQLRQQNGDDEERIQRLLFTVK